MNTTDLEVFCKHLYEATDPNQRAEAERTLEDFIKSPTCIQQCQVLLERSASPYAQLLAATSITKLITRKTVNLSLEHRLEIRNYVLRYLADHRDLQHYVSTALVSLLAKITKLGWFDIADDDVCPFRSIVEEVTKFFGQCFDQNQLSMACILLHILSQIIYEMNHCESNRGLTKHRKTSSSFRDLSLFNIFNLACSTLLRVPPKNLDYTENVNRTFVSQLLQLAHSCLTYDFIGTSPDEVSDDLMTVQIPTSWRLTFLDFTTLNVFFDLYFCLPVELVSVSLSCMAQLASVRRSLFSSVERGKFLTLLLEGIQRVLQNPQKLTNPEAYHEFCRLLARLKTSYQLSELVKVECYSDTLALIANFTVESLRVPLFAANSIHYLMSLWQKMVASVPYVKASEPHHLGTYAPLVTKAYISSRLDSTEPAAQGDFDDLLDDPGLLQQQLEQLSSIARCEYEKTCSLLMTLFDESARKYEASIADGSSVPLLKVVENVLMWLVYIIGAVIGGRVSFVSSDEHDGLDGDLTCRVLKLVKLTDSRLAQPNGPCQKLELAYLCFFDQFRKIYIGEQVQKTSHVYRRLNSQLGIAEESAFLGVMVTKMITNLKWWSKSERVIPETLQLLCDLSVGYSSVRKLVKLESVQYLLNNHTPDNFPFLAMCSNGVTDTRCRTVFYTALSRLIIVELTENNEELFSQFMVPLSRALGTVSNLPAMQYNSFNEQLYRSTMIGLARDLRGISASFNTKTAYSLLVNWIYPAFTNLMRVSLERWYSDPSLTTPLLKLMSELVLNRSQRLQLESSPNGILLFRECSRVSIIYGERIITVNNLSKKDTYPMKLKGISICFNMLKAALCGGYVNFSIFKLYDDPALTDALNMFVKLTSNISQTDLLEYPKVTQSYYSLLEVLTQDHMGFVASLDPRVTVYALTMVNEGLVAIDTLICTECCSTIDSILSYLFKRLSKPDKKRSLSPYVEHQGFLSIMTDHPEIFQQMLMTMVNVVVFEECRNQYSMSRPLMCVILLQEDYYNQLKKSIIDNLPPDKHPDLTRCFAQLMEGIETNLLSKNRERFTQNLALFRRDINDILKSTGYIVEKSIPSPEMMN